MQRCISATYLAKHLSGVLNHVHYRGERFVIERHGEPVASLVPVEGTARVTWREFVAILASLPHPDDEFAHDLAAVQSSQPLVGMPAWDS